jgi:hypothetical protein
MAKSGKSIESVQDNVLNQFSRDIRQYEKRNWLSATEQAILQGQRNKEYQQKQKEKEQVFISFYNPDSPLRKNNK